MIVDIIKISPRVNDSVDYDILVFHVEAAKKLDMESSRDLWILLKALIDGGSLKILVDMKNVDYIDSSGIGVLINAAKLVRLKKGDLILSGVSNEIREILKIVNLQSFIKLFNNDVEALNFFRYI